MDTPTEISESDHLTGTRDIEQGRHSTITKTASQSEVHHVEESLELLGEVYHLASGASTGLLDNHPLILEMENTPLGLASWGSTGAGLVDDHSPILERFRSPMQNTVLHIAAMHGNDAMVDRVATQYPKLLFSCNVNGDSPLHVAARAGRDSALGKLLVACADSNAARLLELMEMENNQGNNMLHEAIVSGHGSMVTSIFHDVEELANYLRETAEPLHFHSLLEEAGWPVTTVEARPMEENAVEEDRLGSLQESCYELAWNKVNKKDQSALCLAVEARLTETVKQILKKCPANATPKGRSPLEAAIMKRDTVMLNIIVSEKQEWIHLRGWFPLHWAAFIGYHEGVIYLLDKCKTCSNERDKYGSLPLHLAARGGHVKVVKELLRYCTVPNEMVDRDLRNILHIAAESGKLDVVRYILQTPALENMINQRDKLGDTPLHVAASMCRPKIVLALIWDDRVDLHVANNADKTARDLAVAGKQVSPSAARSLITGALRYAGATANTFDDSTEPFLAQPVEIVITEESAKALSSRVDFLSLISTLIVTASVAACLSVPGEAEGTAHNLHKAMFHFFIICITISFFSSVCATIILLWGKMDATPSMYASTMDLAMPLIQAALLTLSLAFLAGVYTVISKLTWLATTFLVITAIFVLILCVLLILCALLSSRYLPKCYTNLRYISYYSFIFRAWMIKKNLTAKAQL